VQGFDSKQRTLADRAQRPRTLALDEEEGETRTWIPSAARVHLQDDLQDKGKTPHEWILKRMEEMGDLEENAVNRRRRRREGEKRTGVKG